MAAPRDRAALLRRPAVLVAVLMVVAFVLRAWQIPQIALHGDEYSSIREAQELGRNLNGILFFAILKVWITISQSLVWIRLLPVLIGVAAIPIAYTAGKEAVGQPVGFIMAGLFAVHPIEVEFSLYLRQYGLFLLLSTAALAYTMRVLKAKGRHRSDWVSLGIALVLLPLSQILGLLVTMLILAVLYVLLANRPRRLRGRLLILGAVLGLGLGLLIVPNARNLAWTLFYRAQGTLSDVAYTEPRGLSALQLAKVAVAVYVFALGNRLYPLWLALSVPSIVVFGTGLVLGTIVTWRRRVFWPILAFLLSLLLLFLVLDPLVPALTLTGAPRYALPAWPAMMLLVAAGAAGDRRLIVALGIVTVVCLGAFYSNRWVYGEAPQNWSAAADFATQHANENTLLLYDGRSAEPVRYYFPPDVHAESYRPYAQSGDIGALAQFDRIVFLTNDFHDERRLEFDALLQEIEEKYAVVDGRADGSIQEYAFQRKPPQTSAYLVDQRSGQVRQPVQILGLEFEDLRLPQEAKVGPHNVNIVGAFALPGPDGSLTRLLPLSGAHIASHLLLVSSVLGGASDELIAQVSLHGSHGEVTTLPLRMGIETASWDQPCPRDAPCEPVVKWRKLIALVGQRAYVGAWRDFEASLAGIVLPLPQATAATDEISFKLDCDDCRLYVWAIALLP